MYKVPVKESRNYNKHVDELVPKSIRTDIIQEILVPLPMSLKQLHSNAFPVRSSLHLAADGRCCTLISLNILVTAERHAESKHTAEAQLIKLLMIQIFNTLSSTGLLGNDLSDITTTLCLIHWLRYLIMFWYSTHLISTSCSEEKGHQQ